MRQLTRSFVELTFWFFMLNQGPGKSRWFSSIEYKVWFFGMLRSPHLVFSSLTVIDNLGSFVSILGLPLTALATKNDIVTVINSICALSKRQTEPLSGSATPGSFWSAHPGRSLRPLRSSTFSSSSLVSFVISNPKGPKPPLSSSFIPFIA